VTPCAEHEWHWYPSDKAAANEEGWKCCACEERPGEPPGYSPELDRSHLETKIHGILLDLDTHGFVYVGSGSNGESIVSAVARGCRESSVFDQYSIAMLILSGMTATHALYWQRIGQAIIDGRDERPRCWCGQLATLWSHDENAPGIPDNRCTKHWSVPDPQGRLPF
jgi:hypothetical protein